jgi:DNA polymerase delta subunit 2
MPVHVLPGWTDPSGPILPQQAFPRAMLGPVSQFETFHAETNPAHLHFSPLSDGNPRWTRHLLITSGQTVDDMLKYVKSPPTSRLDLAEGTLLWRHLAPTAPDTLWCHPYFSTDPFVLATAPDVYIIGNQPHAATRTNVSDTGNGHVSRTKIILVPRFCRTGSLVLLNLSNLETRIIKLLAES